MKKLFYLFMVTVCATMFTSCSKDDDKDPLDDNGGNGSKDGMITMVADKGVEEIWIWVDTFNEGDIVTIDWGDGKVEEFKSFRYVYEDRWWYAIGDVKNGKHNEYDVGHKYRSKNKSYTITIKGKIKGFSCEDELEVRPPIISLDVSKCPALMELDCGCNNLTSLDVSKNTALEVLYCYSDNLTSLDVSKNTALTFLWCSGNNLTSLDVSKNTALTELHCHGNNLTSLDVSRNTALTFLECDYNNLTSLDVSGCTALEDLYCSSNNFSASALNQIFKDLPQGKTVTGDGHILPFVIYIFDNPGTATCDKSIATNKGWKVENW